MNRSANQPVVIYDAECAFCSSWAERAQRYFGDRVQLVASVEPVEPVGLVEPSDGISEIASHDVPQSLVMRLPDGTTMTGAHAVFQLLSLNRRWALPLRLYRSVPLFRRFTEFVYRQVARNRSRIAN